MPSSYSSNLRLQLMATGENRSTWGVKANEVFNDLDAAVAGRATVVMASDANYTLTTANGSPDEARYMGLNITSSTTLTATRSVIVPSVSKFYVINNATTGGQTINVRTSTNTTQAPIASGDTAIVWCNGSTCTTQLMPDYASVLSANIFLDTQSIVAGTATTLKNYLQLSPSDLAVGKPALVFQKSATATVWNIGLNDGTNNTGTINLDATIGTLNAVPIVTTTGAQTLTNKTLTSPTVNAATISGTWGGSATFSGTLTLTRPVITLQDSTTTFQDNADNTKQFNFQASGITTATTRTYTVPNYDATFATLAGTETLTNKTLTSPTISSPAITGTPTVGGLELSGWLKISATSLSGATVAVALPSGYRQFKVVVSNASSDVASATTGFVGHASIDSGATYYDISGNYQVISTGTNSSAFLASDIPGATAPSVSYGEWLIDGAPTGFLPTVKIMEAWRMNTSGNIVDGSYPSRVFVVTSSLLTNIRFAANSGSLNNGTVTIYGLKS